MMKKASASERSPGTEVIRSTIGEIARAYRASGDDEMVAVNHPVRPAEPEDRGAKIGGRSSADFLGVIGVVGA
jgi:hypothetical protein